jgi:hypothetical protein
MRDGARVVRAEQQAAGERLNARIHGLAELSDEDLIAKTPARTPVTFPFHEMEMQRRLKVAIQEQTAESVRARRAANRIGIALVALTIVLVALTVVLAVRS